MEEVSFTVLGAENETESQSRQNIISDIAQIRIKTNSAVVIFLEKYCDLF